MNLWSVIGLSVSAMLVGLGIALQQGTAPASGSVLVALGGASAAAVLSFWAAFAMGFGKHAQSHARASSVRIDSLIAELEGHAKTAEKKGILLIADARVSYRPRLFSEGTRRLVAAEPAAAIRDGLGDFAEKEAEKEFSRRSSIALLCRILPACSLALGFASALWMLVMALRAGQGDSSATALGLLCAVYGAFAVSALAGDAAERLRAKTAEDELAASLVIETIVALRAGETPEMVAARLRGMIPPAPEAAAQARPLRRAA